jgi:hypothetical protein
MYINVCKIERKAACCCGYAHNDPFLSFKVAAFCGSHGNCALRRNALTDACFLECFPIICPRARELQIHLLSLFSLVTSSEPRWWLDFLLKSSFLASTQGWQFASASPSVFFGLGLCYRPSSLSPF